MALVETPEADLGWEAPPFTLPGVDGVDHALADERGSHGTVVVFMCNHCPYVKAIVDRLKKSVETMASFGVSLIAICSNDGHAYPDDSYENMQLFSRRHGLNFSYLHDPSQTVARAYGAICTPDFFGFDRDLKLVYRGRLDSGRLESPPPGSVCELVEAMRCTAAGGTPPAVQHPSMGCSIKWRAESAGAP